MKITICGSLHFIKEFHRVAAELEAMGHQIDMPRTAEMALRGEVTPEQIQEEKKGQLFVERVIRQNSIKSYYEKIQQSDAILVLNYTHKGIENYIGGNTMMEIGFAHVLDKKIFLLNPIPEIEYYKSEIEAIQPIILHGDLSKMV